tara:strand:+ start:1498 stop:2241 length:744 start_codon:yes stop_codon:yes gene_type:complete
MSHKKEIELFGMRVNDLSVNEVVALTQIKSKAVEFQYIVTPNVDHLIRFHEDIQFREFYENASHVVNDSRILKLAAKIFTKRDICVAPGSDITKVILEVSKLNERRICIVGCEDSVVTAISDKYNLNNVKHVYPPFGFENKQEEFDDVIDSVEEFMPEYTFLCIGSPKQELLAQELKKRGKISGVGLCVGASLLFLSGDEVRAPLWMQRLSLEWLFRLIQSPKRLAKRYLIVGPKVIPIFLGLKGFK